MKEEEQIEADIKEKGLNAPRLSPGDIDEVVVSEEFILMPSGKAMVCELTLRNGFTVRGESACVSRENFDDDIGRKISYANILRECPQQGLGVRGVSPAGYPSLFAQD